MNTTKIKLTIIGICGLMLVPFSGHASSATLVADNTILFTIDFSFTDELFDIEVPIAAEYGIDYLDRVDTVGYAIDAKNGDYGITKVSGLVLSRSAIEGNRYALPAGTPGDFTLVVLATLPQAAESDYRAYITKLPYWMNERRTTVHQNQLDELNMPVLEVSE